MRGGAVQGGRKCQQSWYAKYLLTKHKHIYFIICTVRPPVSVLPTACTCLKYITCCPLPLAVFATRLWHAQSKMALHIALLLCQCKINIYPGDVCERGCNMTQRKRQHKKQADREREGERHAGKSAWKILAAFLETLQSTVLSFANNPQRAAHVLFETRLPFAPALALAPAPP